MSSAPAPLPENFQPPSFGGYAGVPNQIPGVGFWPRTGARLVDDVLVHGIVSFCTGFLFAVVVAVASGLAGQSGALMLARQRQGGIGMIVSSLLGLVAYHTVCEGGHGSTLGKLMFSMTVVQEDGTACRYWPAFVRSVAYFVDSIFFGFVGYLAMQQTPQEQRHGDNWAHTIVCRRAYILAGNLRGRARFVAFLLLALMADASLEIIGMLMTVRG